MAQPITFRIRGSGETGAPTVDDFVHQLRDFMEIIEGIDAAIGEGGGGAVEWRVTQATTNSPVAIEATPFPRQIGVNVDARVTLIKATAALGFQALASEPTRPAYFNQAILGRAKWIAQRVTNGLAQTDVDWGDDSAPELRLTPSLASDVMRNAELVLRPKTRPYSERGTLEGYHDGIDPHQGKPVLWVRSRRTGDRVRCELTEEANAELKRRAMAEVLEARRVQVRGTLHYKAPHNLSRVTAEHVRIMPRSDELPTLNEILDPNLTGGLSTEAYLEALRDGRIT